MIDRRRLFVKPKSILKVKKDKILEAYNREYASITKDKKALTTWVDRRLYEDPASFHDAELIHRNAGFAGPNRQRGPSAEEEAEMTYQDLLERGAITGTDEEKAEQKALILEQFTENDGFLEQLREYAEGQHVIPVEHVNRLIEMMDAARYDSVVEEARLRRLRKEEGEAMKKKLSQCQDNLTVGIRDASAATQETYALQTLEGIAAHIYEAWTELDKLEGGSPEGEPSRQEAYDQFRACCDARQQVRQRIVSSLAKHPLEYPETAQLDERLRQTSQDVGEAIKTLGDVAHYRYLARSPRTSPKDGEEADGEDAVEDPTVRIQDLKSQLAGARPKIELILPDFLEFTTARETTRTMVRDQIRNQRIKQGRMRRRRRRRAMVFPKSARPSRGKSS